MTDIEICEKIVSDGDCDCGVWPEDMVDGLGLDCSICPLEVKCSGDIEDALTLAKSYLAKHKPKRPKVRYRAVEDYDPHLREEYWTIINSRGEVYIDYISKNKAKTIAAALNKC